MKVLIVDDDQQFLQGLKDEFEIRRYEVVTASCGKEALERFGAEDFDLVTLDILLPDIDGIRILRRMKEERPKTIIVMVTNYDYRDDLAVWASEGYILKKNLDFKEIASAVEAVLSWQKTGEIKRNR